MKKTVLALAVSLAMAGCNSGSSPTTGQPSEVTRPDPTVMVPRAQGTPETRLACQRPGEISPACNLRIYQVMVESFMDGDPGANFNTGYGTSHHKGDLAGITASLDYIQSLGFNTLWLTPIFHSATISGQDEWADRLDATGYFASNFFAIDPRFGTLEQAKELVEQAHDRGMYVLLDGVFGHFKQNASEFPSPSGKVLSQQGEAQAGTGRKAIYPQDLEFFREVATYWVRELKIDGWRLDQAYQVPVEYWSDLREAVEKTSRSVTYKGKDGQPVNPLGYMVAEIWNTPGYIVDTGYHSNEQPGLLSAFDFPLRNSVAQVFGSDKNAIHGRPASQLQDTINLSSIYPDHAMPNLMLGNHDIPRFGNLLQRGRLATPDDQEYWDRHKAAFSFMAAYSGPVTLYYNEEIGAATPGFTDPVPDYRCAKAGLCDDHVSRTSGRIEGIPSSPGEPAVVLSPQEKDLKNYVSQLMALRTQHPALYSGSRTHIYSDDSIYIDRKDQGDDSILFMVNTSLEPVTINLKPEAIGSKGALDNLLNGDRIVSEDGQYRITLSGLESLFLGIGKTGDIQFSEQAVTTSAFSSHASSSDHLTRCDLPAIANDGPLLSDMWIRGSYQNGKMFQATPDSHRFTYRGNDIYQVVVDEPRATAYTFKFASKDWRIEYAVEHSAAVQLGKIQKMGNAPGFGTESSIMIPEPGKYVYGFRINAPDGENEIYVGRCTP